MSYLASPLWLLLLVVTSLEGIKEKVAKHQYFAPAKAYFPVWHISVQQQALMLFGVMMTILLLPKFLSVLVHWRKRERLRAFGGGFRMASSAIIETLVSTLLAPNLALLQAKFVIGILISKVEWKTQDRGETSTSCAKPSQRHWPSTLIGLAWTATLALTVPSLIWWFSPVIAGFVFFGDPAFGFQQPGELGAVDKKTWPVCDAGGTQPPDLLRRFQRELARQETMPWSSSVDGLGRVLQDSATWAVHVRLLQGSPVQKDLLDRNRLEGLELKLRQHGLEALTAKEKRVLLLDADSLRVARDLRLAAERAPLADHFLFAAS